MWVEWFTIEGKSDLPFQWYIGTRGVGKTYSALKLVRDYSKSTGYERHIMYIRYVKDELLSCYSDDGNPYKVINKDFGINVFIDGDSKGSGRIWECDTDGEEHLIGYCRSLSSFSNLRGVSFEDVDIILFDEIAPSERTVRLPIYKRAGEVFAGAYETINRNRELTGSPPVRVYFLGNSFKLSNSLYQTFGIIPILEKMKKENLSRWSDRRIGQYVDFCKSQNVSDFKRNTAIYRATAKESDFQSVALENDFLDTGLDLIKDVRLIEYNPIIYYEGRGFKCSIFRHKSSGELYVAMKNSTATKRYSQSTELKFYSEFSTIYKVAILDKDIYFETFRLKLLLDELMYSPKI